MIKVLYVEDHPSQRDVMKQTLELHGYEVMVANDGQEGIEKAHQMQPDIILMDLRLPGIDGHKIIQKLKQDTNLSTIPIIAMSAWADKKNREKALEAGANLFLAKPVEFGQFLTKINDLVNTNQ